MSQKNYKGRIYAICALLTKKSEKDCTVSTVDCEISVDPSSLHILTSIPERHSANLYISTVSLVYSQNQLKTTDRRRCETDTFADSSGSRGISFEGMRQRQTEKCGCDA